MTSAPTLVVHGGRPLTGTIEAPADRALGLAALVLGAVTVGATRVQGLPPGADTGALAPCLAALGARIEGPKAPDGGDEWVVRGTGLGGLRTPDAPLDLSAAPMAAPWLLGLLAGHPIKAVVLGPSGADLAALMAALRTQAGSFEALSSRGAPVIVTGGAQPLAGEHAIGDPPLAGARILCGLTAPGTTRLVAPAPWPPDPIERLAPRFGVALTRAVAADGTCRLSLVGEPETIPALIAVGPDGATAVALALAGRLVPGSRVTVTGVGEGDVDPVLARALRGLGFDPGLGASAPPPDSPLGAEPLDLDARAIADLGPTLPLVLVAAALGPGLGPMPLTDPVARSGDLIAGLAALGAGVTHRAGSVVIEGLRGRTPRGGQTLSAGGDAMTARALILAALAAETPVRVRDLGAPGLIHDDVIAPLRRLGARIDEEPA